ncbi:uncharacterized protein LOC114185991 [Vigna unguiculata]|uniref:Late embryogenesis abundant protein n=1 Tax=Vigna unguiculata TaxID=3917 RepID=A0A4D6NFM6_VIGUN|nr:uncharacterized protein LOC114185991 [Vigna unguiculata]XP_027929784.1 uncharacterized protein LOC114185991 [Vigna unguiculata]QCE12158.1 Late embryogenesis abundant protein [Vigna unguiculata]
MKEGSGSKGGMTMCLVLTLCLIIAILLVMVLLAFTVFRPHEPVSRVDTIKVADMNLGMDFFSMSVNVNVTLDVGVSVQNRNKFGFEFHNSSAILKYKGLLIGEGPIPDGEVSGGETMGMNLTLTIMADRLATSNGVTSDIASGLIPLSTLVRMFGMVKVLGFIRFHVASTTSCDFTLNISNKTIVDNKCLSKAVLSA